MNVRRWSEGEYCPGDCGGLLKVIDHPHAAYLYCPHCACDFGPPRRLTSKRKPCNTSIHGDTVTASDSSSGELAARRERGGGSRPTGKSRRMLRQVPKVARQDEQAARKRRRVGSVSAAEKKKRGYSRDFTPRTERRLQITVDKVPATLFDQVKAKAKREGISIRALVLAFLKEWVSK